MNFTIYADPAVCIKLAEQSENAFITKLQGVVSTNTSTIQATLPLSTWPTIKQPLNEGRLFKTDGKRRARNVESSRKYRKRRRERFQGLEQANRRLQEQIEDVERHLQQLNYAFHLFMQHAECCEHCSNIRIGE